MQNFALGLVERLKVHMDPALQISQDHSGWHLFHVNCSTQLGDIGKLAEGALYPAVHVTIRDVKQRQSQY